MDPMLTVPLSNLLAGWRLAGGIGNVGRSSGSGDGSSSGGGRGRDEGGSGGSSGGSGGSSGTAFKSKKVGAPGGDARVQV